MTIIEWFALATVCFLGAATPGPSLAIIINHTIKSGRNAGYVASFTHAFAVGFYAVATIYGLAELFKVYPTLAQIIAYAGAFYLAYLAVKILISTSNSSSTNSTKLSSTEAAVITHGKKQLFNAAQDAFMVAFLNPKLAFFFIALFSQFIPQDETSIELAIILTSTVFIIDFVWYLIVVSIVCHGQKKLNVSQATGNWFLRLQAVIFLLISINTVLWQ